MDVQDFIANSSFSAVEDTYRKVFDQVVDTILIHDRETLHFVDANASALKLYGYTLDELRAMTPFDLHPLEEHERVRENIDAPNVDDPHVYTHLTRDGRRIAVEIRSDAVEFQGRAAWLTIIRDISERQQAEAELTRAHQEAVQASQHKSEYVAALSHELRTPMTGLLGMASLLLDTALDEEQREYAETIQAAGESMLELLNEILDLRRLESGKLEIQELPFDPREMTEDVLRLLQPLAREKQVELRVAVDDRLPARLAGDSVRLRQVLLNLGVNALKFTTEGHVRIAVECGPQRSGRAALRISVDDTGAGIDPEKLDRVFEPYVQAHQDPERRYGGSGLGLAISRQLVEAMQGRITARSEKGKGSTFQVELELRVAESELEAAPAAAPVQGRILLVHSDAHRRATLARWLEEWGLVATVVADSARALETLRDEASFELALVAYALVDLDGETLGRSLRLQGAPPPRLVLLDPTGGRLDPARMERAGFSAVLPDAVQADRLRQELERLLPRGKEALRAALASSPATEPEVEAVAPELAVGCPVVLVVEDNVVNQKVILHMLEKMGCTVHLAVHGGEALDHLVEQGYDLIFMDCQMPEMDGYEATRHIRAMGGERAGTPVVALTANAMDGDRTKCLAAGMDDYMSKPATSTQLRDMLAKWVPRCAACIYEGNACLS